MKDNNPKLLGTEIVDCIPQVGECKIQCSECFYNGGRFFRALDTPLMPTEEEIDNKIIRVNSGNDSNNQKELVLKVTKDFPNKFYNTSIPNFDFPGPVVFTCNGGKNSELKLIKPDNLMFVRVRTNSWDVEIIDTAIEYYINIYKTPVVITFMRYYNRDLIPEGYKNDYEWKKNILNNYFCIKQETILKIMKRYNGTGVRYCGNIVSSTCIDCRNCELLYWRFLNINK
jgi:hypothetical protein